MEFPGQLPNERVILLVRRHTFVLIRQVLLLVIAMLLPLVVSYFLQNYTTVTQDPTSLLYLLIVLGGSVYYLFIILFLFSSWVDYYLDIWVVTSDRIVSIEQKGLFSRTVGELKLYRVQDVTSNVRGFLPTMFRYGDVRIETAGEQSQFTFEQVPHPEQVAKIIMEAHDRSMQEKGIQVDGMAQVQQTKK